jgi:hypothetical protein
MHSLSASFVLAYHGCERETGEKLLRYEAFRPSENTYDWLGSGIYFWEANPDRAYDWAVRHAERIMQKTGAIVKPFVVGAAIDLGFCLDLIGTNGLQAVERAYSSFCDVIAASGAQIPENIGGTDLDLRRLDCAVINFLHDARKKAGDQEFDTVRAVFTEGDPLYPKSGFRHKTHIQICVRNQSAIKAVFRVPPGHFSSDSSLPDAN